MTKNQSGTYVPVTGSIKVPAAGVTGLTAGDAITIYNPGPSSLAISVFGSPAIIPIYYLVGTTITPSILAVNGLATFLCVDSGGLSNPAKFIVTGRGLS